MKKTTKLVSINVFETDDCLNDHKIIIHRGTKNRNAKHEIDLLKIYDEDNNYHYVLVKNKSRLLNFQSNKHINKKHYCHHCLNPFSTLPPLVSACRIVPDSPSLPPPPPRIRRRVGGGGLGGGVILYPLLGVRHAEQCRRTTSTHTPETNLQPTLYQLNEP